jgi:hypothetical protein
VLVFDPMLAATDPSAEEKLRAIRLGFILIMAIGIIGVLLIVALLAAWRNFHKRLKELEAERDELRRAAALPDVWQTAGERVRVEPPPGFGESHEEDTGPDEPDDETPGWRPEDDDEDEDDEFGDRRPW